MENVNFMSRSTLKCFATFLLQVSLDLVSSGNDDLYVVIVHYKVKPQGLSSCYQVSDFKSRSDAERYFHDLVCTYL